MNLLKETPATIELSSSVKRAIRCVIYYSLFRYPLRFDELYLSESDKQKMDELVASKKLFGLNNYYSTLEIKDNLERRLQGNKLYDQTIDRAIKRAKFIFQFPFVEGVYISGSMSKGFMTEDGDVDFFIVTKPGRLWLARTILILFKKVFLANSRKFFCLNYFVDSDHLEIEEQNIFTATELITLIPVCDRGVLGEFNQKNQWVKHFYPNANFRIPLVGECKKGFLFQVFESVLKTKIGSWLDKRCMSLTLNVWKKKFGNFKPDDFDLALKSRTYVSKHHPQNFQKKVLTEFEERVNEFEKKHNLDLGL
ncbi:MAG: nucleotidyltransferase domain-containing protein [Salibacteraceae bacterium]